MAVNMYFVLMLCCTLTNESLVLSEHIAMINETFKIEWQMDHARRVDYTILKKDGEELLRLDPHTTEINKGQFYAELNSLQAVLIISNVTLENAGSYLCIIYYSTGSYNDKPILLHVQGHPDLVNVSSVIVEGETINAVCCVTSSVEPPMTWLVDTKLHHDTIHAGVRDVEEVSDHTYCGQIQFESDRSYNDKELICEVNNNVYLSTSSPLHVFYQPTVNIAVNNDVVCTNGDCTFEEFTDVTVVCTTDGNPKPNVTLQKQFTTENRYEWNTYYIENGLDSTIKWYYLFSNITRKFHGKYECAANNGIGSAGIAVIVLNISFSVTLQMLTSPSNTLTSNGKFSIECETYSNPLPRMSLQKKIHGIWTTIHSAHVPEIQQSFNAVWKFSHDNASIDYEGEYRCMADNGVGLPAVSNSTYAFLPKDESEPISWIPILSCFIVILVLVISAVTALYYRKRQSHQITHLSRRGYMRRFQSTDTTACFPDVVRSHHTVSVDSTMSNRRLPIEPYTEDDDVTNHPVDSDPDYEKCSIGDSDDKMSAVFQVQNYDCASGSIEMDIDGYAKINKNTASMNDGCYEDLSRAKAGCKTEDTYML